MIIVHNVRLPDCGHVENNVRCYKTASLATIKCTTIVSKQVPECIHAVKIKCSEDILTPGFKYHNPCGSILPCGHQCSGSCGRCNSRNDLQEVATKHFRCKKVCGRLFGTCSHTCPRFCHEDVCGACSLPCEVRCSHSNCTLKCSP
jgi:hypothetical protein